MKEILVAIDGSKYSEEIVDYASELAISVSAKILLIYVMPEVRIPEEYERYAKTEHLDPSGYFAAVGEQIIAQMGRRIEKKGVEYEGTYEAGNPTAKILETATKTRASLIVVGLRGLHGIGKVRSLGSTARRIIENSTIPVLVVPL